jgi:hypothetical protein
MGRSRTTTTIWIGASMVEETQDKDITELYKLFKYNIPNDEILSGKLKILVADLSWKMDLPTWTKEELDIMCSRMDALVEVSNLLYDIQWHRLNWERKTNG